MTPSSTPPAAQDPRPFYWALGIVALLLLIGSIFTVIGGQRLANGALWRAWHPLTLVSPPQMASLVAVTSGRQAQTVVQTEKGVYFLTGDQTPPQTGEAVIAAANARWDLYLCRADGERCMSIHSFCARAAWPNLQRDASGRVAGCEAPLTAEGTQPAVAAIVNPPPDRAGQRGGRDSAPPPAVGVRHPRYWGREMGLPVPYD